VDIHLSARKHGIADADIKHATTHAMTIENQDDDIRLYLGLLATQRCSSATVAR
jgi:hypothetical protein